MLFFGQLSSMMEKLALHALVLRCVLVMEEVNYFNPNVVGFLCPKLLITDKVIEENLPRVGWSLP